MKILTQMHVVQFSFWEYESFNLRLGGTAFLGPNGAGKTSMVDAIQIALLGGNTKKAKFNTQIAQKGERTLRDYALGAMRSDNTDNAVISRKRDEAISYISLIFEGERPEHVVSLGICIHATAKDRDHSILGLYILPGVRLILEDHLGAIGQSEKAPLEWPVFDAQIRRMAKEAGRLPTISSNVKVYQQELLHCLQHKGRTIQPEKFVRAFVQSLQLKNIESVSDYLRGYLIDSQSIDKSGTLSHIKNVRRLAGEIAKVKDQIVFLESLDRRFQNLNGYFKSVKASQTVHLQLKIESQDELVEKLLQKESKLAEELKETHRAQVGKEGETKLLLETWQNLVRAYNADPESKQPEENRALQAARVTAASERKLVIERLARQIRDSLEKTMSALKVDYESASFESKNVLKIWEKIHESGDFPAVTRCEEAIIFLTKIESKVSMALEQATERASIASSALKIEAQRLQAIKRGERLPKDNDKIPTAMALFADQGIGSTTVASLVRVCDERWQPAIESYLGGNRFALVVDPGRERDAIRIMRTTGKDIFNVTVVQPEHLREMLDRPVVPHSVAGLIAGDNKVAVSFLRRCIGTLRQVYTEEDLEKFDRALTSDGMLSSNGGTRRIPLVTDRNQWELGTIATKTNIESVQGNLSVLIKRESDAKEFLRTCREADEAIRRARRECSTDQYGAALTAFSASKKELEATEVVSMERLPLRLKELQVQINQTKSQADAAGVAQVTLATKCGAMEIDLKTTEANIQVGQEQLGLLQRHLVDTRQGVDYSEDVVVELYTTASRLHQSDGESVVMKWLQDKLEVSQRGISKWEPIVLAEFREFISSLSVNLIEERSDWRKAWRWTAQHHEKLRRSTLVEFEANAEEAKLLADKAFRSDVAYKIRDSIKCVEHDIGELNKILTGCPEFTGGEKYKFRADPAQAFEELYKLIQGSALRDGAALPLDGANEATQTQLLKLLEACETGSMKGANPLEDYRLLFNFDLDIYVEGKRVDSLSKRLGVGSNGEHLVPFYVIAGASLSNAYGMKPGAEYDGAAVMLIDEAFHGFDAQNTFVTGQFLRSLGLQLVMAAPDADVGKLIPVVDSFYDLNRFGTDVFPLEHVLKEPTQELAMVDIPGRNPKLIEDRITQLSLIE
ncbi:MAG: SbcC/MukB-like Walker B domain-containing protein [Undibacterium umbellatum]|uniref:SbcC/MukB-like Walker B domain-containing protein n=1 Tax=Undibacterium umbellatum TaxID=2762300 RepID=UPI003BB68815